MGMMTSSVHFLTASKGTLISPAHPVRFPLDDTLPHVGETSSCATCQSLQRDTLISPPRLQGTFAEQDCGHVVCVFAVWET